MRIIFYLYTFFFISLLHAEGFVATTIVYTPSGVDYIKNFNQGDLIWAPKHYSNPLKIPIQKVITKHAEFLVHLVVDDDLISLSPSQQLLVAHKGWMKAKNIQAGDYLITLHGTQAKVVSSLLTHEPTTVYIIVTKTVSTFAVGEHGLVTRTMTN